MRNDPHSFARPEEAIVKNIRLDATVDFETKTITAKASIDIENIKAVKQLYLDSNDLTIERVTIGAAETPGRFSLGEPARYLGRPLIIEIQPDTTLIHIYYRTSPSAAALQWLDPAQTSGGKMPFLYTQSQAILARSWVPCQDTPGVRMPYQARIHVPRDMMAIMSAENVTVKNPTGIYEFNMPQRIPSYLLALTVGDLEFRATGPRTGVYSEPAMVEKAAWEFGETEKMIEAAEKLYGPYRWGRYDLNILPPSFPWGGMENPRLTFATPVVIVGDRSLVSLVAHELAHSWSGNLVTNATWDDFWLNEGFTTYFDHRIMEAVYGKEYDDMLSVLSVQDLQKEVRELGPTNSDTQLKTDFTGRDPEDTATQIPYEKGQFFLRTIEQAVGRPRFDAFLKGYFDHFAFQSITTEDFLDYLREHLIRGDKTLEESLRIQDWVYKPGLPSNMVKVRSTALEKVDEQMREWVEGKSLNAVDTSKWSTQHWMHFIRMIPENVGADKMKELDSAFHFSHSQNAEILHEWLLQVIARQYKPAYSAIERLLEMSGRRKYVKSIFTALIRTPDGLRFARGFYGKLRPRYHAVTRDIGDRLLQWNEK